MTPHITLIYRRADSPRRPVALPASKSIAARMLMADALAGSRTRLLGLPDCEDTAAMLRAVDALRQGKPEAFMGAAGTSLRFATALAAATPGADITLLGTPRLAARPLAPLLDALAAQGALFSYKEPPHALPLRVRGTQLAGGEVEVDAHISSQFLSALMLAAPAAAAPTRLRLVGGEPVSMPYVRMTAAVMARFGVDATIGEGEVCIPATPYTPPEELTVEADWSAAAFIYEAAALMPPGTRLHIASLTPPALTPQGDARAAAIFRQLGVESEFNADGSATLVATSGCVAALELDLADAPDMVPALAVAACLKKIPFRFTGIHHLRVKECDRLAVLADLLARIGFTVTVGADGSLSHDPAADTTIEGTPRIDPHDDHRMAMAFAVAAIRLPQITILDPATVAKSFPGFWKEAEALGIAPI